eukprot:2673573-Amphidinium_carterae.1
MGVFFDSAVPTMGVFFEGSHSPQGKVGSQSPQGNEVTMGVFFEGSQSQQGNEVTVGVFFEYRASLNKETKSQ